jgi:Spy/CpxP family protein refolding chaperone
MMRKGWHGYVAGIVALAVLATAGWAAAQPAAPHRGARHGQRLLTPEDRAAVAQIFWQRVKERLALTDEQAADLRSTLEARRQAMRADFESLRGATRQLRELMAAPTADPGAIQTAAAQVKSLRDKLFDERIQSQLALRAKLTPEQYAKWLELGKGAAMRHRGRGPGAGFGRM